MTNYPVVQHLLKCGERFEGLDSLDFSAMKF